MEWPLPLEESDPYDIAISTTGTIWFTEQVTTRLGRLDILKNKLEEVNIPTSSCKPAGIDIANKPSLLIWFTEKSVFANKIGNFNPIIDVLREWSLPVGAARPEVVRVDQVTGEPWFTEPGANRIGRLLPDNDTVVEWVLPVKDSGPYGLFLEGSGDTLTVWFTEETVGRIGRLVPSTNVLTEWTLPDITPLMITVDEKGLVYFTDPHSNRICQLDPTTHILASWMIPTTDAHPYGIIPTTDGKILITEMNTNKISLLEPTIIGKNTILNSTITTIMPTIKITKRMTHSLNQKQIVTNSLTPVASSPSGVSLGGFVEWSLPSPNSGPYNIVSNQDNFYWFTERSSGEFKGNRIGLLEIQEEITTMTTETTPLTTITTLTSITYSKTTKTIPGATLTIPETIITTLTTITTEQITTSVTSIETTLETTNTTFSNSMTETTDITQTEIPGFTHYSIVIGLLFGILVLISINYKRNTKRIKPTLLNN